VSCHFGQKPKFLFPKSFVPKEISMNVDSQIQSLRDQVDNVNLELLALLSKRAQLVTQIGERQTDLGLRHYDPSRESQMLEVLEQANPGPFSNGTIKQLFKEVFKASLDLEEKQDKPKLKYSRKAHPDDSKVVVTRGDIRVEFGGSEKVLISGPCSIESWEQMNATAEFVKSRGVTLMRGGAYKPRTSPYGFQGLGVEGLQYGAKAAQIHGLLFVAEVMDTRDVAVCAEYADMLQVGTRNAQNFALLKEVGKSGKPVLLKRGFSSTMEEWLLTAEYILAEGNDQIVLCERGIRTFEKWTRNTLDLSAVAVAKLETHLPIIVDVTHAAGRRDILIPLAKAALAVGADGIHVEVHPDPATALSDNQQQLDFAGFDAFLKEVQPHL
jgi:3-deoxy-7-phosphoheptulonate synthase / chorismate mutase